MTTLLLTHPASLDHLMPSGHPERPDRIRAIDQVLAEDRFNKLVRGRRQKDRWIGRALSQRTLYRRTPAYRADEGLVYLDGDTSMSPGTWEAVMRGVGGAVAATEAVMAGTQHNAFVAMRPPGHHAETDKPMGFCFFDHAAIAARHAQRKYGIARAAVVDFDVHHGNGTQDIFWADPTVMYCSTHQMPLFPGTGATGERGEHDTIVNAPLASGDGGVKFRAAFENLILPQLEEIRARTVHHLRRLRRASPRSAGKAQSGGGRFRLGHPQTDGCRRRKRGRPSGFGARGRLRSAGAERVGGRACHGIDGRVNSRHNMPAKISLSLRRQGRIREHNMAENTQAGRQEAELRARDRGT